MSTAQHLHLLGSSHVSSVKEYSLFDNHFSKAVESVLKNDICASSARSAFTGVPSAVASCPAVDEALLAKAPGYRASTASPCGGRLQVERPRKYSNDSSSSLSSVKSRDDSPSSGRLLAPPHLPRPCHQIPDIPCSSAFHPVHNLPPLVPVCAPSAFSDLRSTAEVVSQPLDNDITATSVAGPHVVSEQYSSPNEPMTLPRILTNLNPNAPDFVFRPMMQISPADNHDAASTSIHPDVPLATSGSDGFFIPDEMMVPDSGRWNEPVVGMTDGETLLAATAFDMSMPELALDVSQRQWTVHNNLLQESLTFG